MGELEIALKELREAESIAGKTESNDHSDLGTVYNLIGYLYSCQENYGKSIEYITKGIRYNSKFFGEKSEKVASGYYSLGVAYKFQGKFDLAYRNLLQAASMQKELYGERYYFLPVTLTMLGSVCTNKNENDRALNYFNQALSLFEKSDHPRLSDMAVCYLNMMTAYDDLGKYLEAIECGKKTIQIYSDLSMPNHVNVACAYGTLGEIYTTLGDYQNAREDLEHSLSIYTKRYPEKAYVSAKLTVLLGNVYMQTGDIDNALRYSLDGVNNLEHSSTKDNPEIGYMYKQLGDVYNRQQNYTKALQYYFKAVASRKEIKGSEARADISSLYSSIGNVYGKEGKYTHALSYLRKAQSIDNQLDENNPQKATTLVRFGELLDGQGLPEQAIAYYHKAALILSDKNSSLDITSVPQCDKTVYKKELLDIVVAKGDLLEKLYDKTHNMKYLTASLSHYQKAMDLVDDVRKFYTADASKLHLVEKSQSIYTNACRIAISLEQKTQNYSYAATAFLIADRDKANIILEKLFDGEAKHYANIPDSLLNQEKDLLRNIAFIETHIYQSNNKNSNEREDDLASLRSKLFELKSRHQKLVELFEREYPKYYTLKYSRYTLTLGDIQKTLDRSTALIEYLFDNTTMHVFYVNADTLIVKNIENSSSINADIDNFVSALKKYETRNVAPAGYELYSKVLLPVESESRSCAKLIIIPDGNLYYVPFEALPTRKVDNASITDFTTMPYLIRRNEISYSYSAQFYLTMNREKIGKNVSASSFVGFAPVFGDSVKNGDLLANRSYVEESGLSDVRAITLDGKTFNELKYSEDEVESISKSFKEHSLVAKDYLFTGATETNFKKNCSKYDIIHVATHGFINEKNPKFSAILFSQPGTRTEEDDGILYVDETFNLDLKANLVVLSSCESGLGKLVQGEGMIALTRGLFYAGAKNIIFSLWKVSDKQTYVLMDRFYKQMLDGNSYSSSLRDAKLQMIASKESAFPSKWSGFVLVGQ